MEIDLPGAQALFGIAPGKPEMLSSAELAKQVVAREALGLSAGEQRYEIAARYADSLAGVAGSLVAAALALRARRRGHLNASVVEGVATAVGLWGAAAIFKSLSLANRAPPLVCALGPIVVAAGLGLLAIALQARRPAG
jgi:lipopolysaccharide export LptBFGC system permease protein LptF